MHFLKHLISFCVFTILVGIANPYGSSAVEEHELDAFRNLDALDWDTGWVLTWGGNAVFDRAVDSACDSSGNIYTVGIFSVDVDFDPGPGTHTVTGDNSFFLSKFSPDGTFQWVRSWQGADMNVEPRISINGNNIFVTGWISGSGIDIDPTANVQIYDGYQLNAFLVKFDSSGNFQWIKTWGGEWMATVNDIATTTDGSIYLAGSFGGRADLAPGEPESIYEATGRIDGYFCKLDSSAQISWIHTFGGPGGSGIENDCAYGIRVIDGTVYVTGGYNGLVDFDFGDGRYFHESNGLTDAFIATYDTDGTYLWSTSLGGSGDDYGMEVDTDGGGNIYCAGIFENSVAFNTRYPNARTQAPNEDSTFISKYSPAGEYDWTVVLTNLLDYKSIDFEVDNAGNSYICGRFRMEQSILDEMPEDAKLDQGSFNVIFYHFDSGGIVTHCVPIEWYGPCVGKGMAIYGNNTFYLAGMFDHIVDFDPGASWNEVDERQTSGNMDAFLFKFTLN
ncbi:MAG TPA: hypothetical protein VGB30_14805 [bacterium]|jgi:hypothetical protein